MVIIDIERKKKRKIYRNIVKCKHNTFMKLDLKKKQ